jgi:hypothetical protein
MAFSPWEQAGDENKNRKEIRIIAGRELKEGLKLILPVLILVNGFQLNLILNPGQFLVQ